MVTEQQLIDLILIAQSYNLELGEKMIDEQKKGCDDCADKLANQILQIIMLVEQLYYKIDLNDYGEETESLYACLLGAVGAYSGASLSLDPNAVNPNITIEVEIIGNNQPNELTFYWSDFIDNGEEGRVRYENAELAGWTPIFVIGNIDKHLLKYVDFEPLSTGGFELKSDGNIPAIYEGQIGWIVGYEPYVAPTPSYPAAGTYRLVNNSEIDTSYFITSSIPLVVGQTVNSAFTLGDSLLGQIAVGQKLNFTRYLSDGTVDTTLELTNPPSNQLNTSVMDLTKSYEFIYTDNPIVATLIDNGITTEYYKGQTFNKTDDSTSLIITDIGETIFLNALVGGSGMSAQMGIVYPYGVNLLTGVPAPNGVYSVTNTALYP